MKRAPLALSLARAITGAIAAFGIGIIRLYQLLLSPLIGPVCRYHPTCSHYGIEAIRHHGPWLGAWLTLRRLLRCHPWGGSGSDPVPPARAGNLSPFS